MSLLGLAFTREPAFGVNIFSWMRGLLAATIGCVVLAGFGGGVARAAPGERAEPLRIQWSVRGGAGEGSGIVVRGKVIPAARHGRIVLQLRWQGAWRRLDGGALHNGRFRLHPVLPEGLAGGRIRVLLFEGGRRVAVSAARGFRLRRFREAPPPNPAPPSVILAPPSVPENPSRRLR
jgi:hypothetical protein